MSRAILNKTSVYACIMKKQVQTLIMLIMIKYFLLYIAFRNNFRIFAAR